MNRIRSHAGVGASSILLIFVVLSLTSFGVLTLVSARADKNLTARTVETTKAYYTADAAAQQKLLAIDEALLGGVDLDMIDGLTPDESAPNAYVFRCETGDGRAIRVRIARAAGESRCTILEYKLVHIADWSGADDLTLAIPDI